jgi:hypothetical protein
MGFAAVSGCGGARQPATRSAAQHASADMRAFARCVRAHGQQDFPDPRVANGVPGFPDSAPRVSPIAQHACGHIVASIPSGFTSTQPVSSTDLQTLLTFARCMRAHGLHDWPDPNALGQFALDQELRRQGKQVIAGAGQTCERLVPGVSGYTVIEGH